MQIIKLALWFGIASLLVETSAFAGTVYDFANLNETSTCSDFVYCLEKAVLTTTVDSIQDHNGYQTWNLTLSMDGFDLAIWPYGEIAFPVGSFVGNAQLVVYARTGDATGLFAGQFTSVDLFGFLSTNGGDYPGASIDLGQGLSRGAVQVSDTGGGNFHVESFFDIFTDFNLNDFGPDTFLSTSDHYASANAPAGPAPAIVPEPATLTLLPGAGLVFVAFFRRKSRASRS
jgi:hypothetical protein